MGATPTGTAVRDGSVPAQRPGDRGAISAPGLSEHAPQMNLQLERPYHTSGGAARAEAAASPPQVEG